MFMIEVEFMNMIVKLFLPVLSLICYTSTLSANTIDENSICSYQNITEQEVISHDDTKSYIDILLSNIENLQKSIDDIELDFNRELNLKLDDLLGFRKTIHRELENSNSVGSWISDKLKLYKVNQKIKKIESQIHENNAKVEALNKAVDFINEEIIQITKSEFINKISEKYCKFE